MLSPPMLQDKLLVTHEVRIKELEGSKAKLQASAQASGSQLEKHRKSAEELRLKCQGLEAQLNSVRKVRELL